jgi:hypothetical protein
MVVAAGAGDVYTQDSTAQVVDGIAVTASKGEKKVPLLIYKNYWGIVTRELKRAARRRRPVVRRIGSRARKR